MRISKKYIYLCISMVSALHIMPSFAANPVAKEQSSAMWQALQKVGSAAYESLPESNILYNLVYQGLIKAKDLGVQTSALLGDLTLQAGGYVEQVANMILNGLKSVCEKYPEECRVGVGATVSIPILLDEIIYPTVSNMLYFTEMKKEIEDYEKKLKENKSLVFTYNCNTKLPLALQIRAYFSAIKNLLKIPNADKEAIKTKDEIIALITNIKTEYEKYYYYLYSILPHSFIYRNFTAGLLPRSFIDKPLYEYQAINRLNELINKQKDYTEEALKKDAIPIIDYLIKYWANTLIGIPFHKIYCLNP